MQMLISDFVSMCGEESIHIYLSAASRNHFSSSSDMFFTCLAPMQLLPMNPPATSNHLLHPASLAIYFTASTATLPYSLLSYTLLNNTLNQKTVQRNLANHTAGRSPISNNNDTQTSKFQKHLQISAPE